MLVWRLCRRPHADLSGEGGRLASGRWHTAGKPVIYTAYVPALSILEVGVHLDLSFEDLSDDYVLMGIDIIRLTGAMIVADPPMTSIADPRAFGNAWLVGKIFAVLRALSVLAPGGGIKYLVNPLNPDAKEAIIAGFQFDGRL